MSRGWPGCIWLSSEEGSDEEDVAPSQELVGQRDADKIAGVHSCNPKVVCIQATGVPQAIVADDG